VFTRVLVTGLTALLAVPAAAQQVQPDLGGQPAEEALKEHLRTFEGVLQVAVENGGARLARRARQIVPDVQLAMRGTPVTNPVPIPGIGYHFDVQVPDILGTSLSLFELYTKMRQADAGQPSAGDPMAREVAATGVIQADPMTIDPAFDPNREYGVFVKEALIDAMLDSSGALPLRPGERLIVSARVPADVQANPLSSESHRRLVLQIRAEDLEAYRLRQIDRETARGRILESRH
jgi:hypothetical protein